MVSYRFRDMKRFEQILHVIIKYELGSLLEQLGIKKISMTTPAFNPHPIRIRAVLEELGGTFVKLGQLLSTRPDLLPWEYCKEFSKLQDSVKPVPYDKIEKTLEELKKKFKYVNPKPIASASIGQVHEAELKNGERVAVKVQKPNVAEKIAADMDILVYFANIIEKHFKPKVFDTTEIVAEFKDYTEKELDYFREASNLEKFHATYENTEVKIPKVYWDYCSKNILTMEFIPGIKLKDIIMDGKDFNKKLIAENLTNAIFIQIFEHGRFHADPHPSNIMILHKKNIAFLDFGIVGRISEKMQQDLSLLFISLIRRDLEGVASSLLKLQLVENNANTESFREDIRDLLGKYYEAPLDSLNLSELISKAFDVAKDNNVKFHKNFVLLGKCIITLEGTCVELDPKFNIVEVAKPYIGKLMAQKAKYSIKKLVKKSVEIKEFLEDLPELGRGTYKVIKEADEYIKKIDEDIKGVRKEVSDSTMRLTYGIVAGCLLMSAALVAGLEQKQMFGIPAFSFFGLVLAGLFILILILSIIEDKFKWKD